MNTRGKHMHSTELNTANEKETIMNVAVTEIPPLGYGNKASAISYDKQLASGELTTEVVLKSKELITSGACMREVTDGDDGCIDGRPAHEVLYPTDDGQFVTREIIDAGEHVREKVAGGGYMTGFAMLRGVYDAGVSIDADLARTGTMLTEQGIHCGAHTGSHAHGEATDCGANDKVRDILQNAVEYRQEISDGVKALTGVAGIEFDQTRFATVLNRWADTLTDDAYFGESTGKSRFDVIQQNVAADQEKSSGDVVAVSKDLAGDHKEDFIVINYIDNYSFSQAEFAKQLSESVEDGQAQAFVVDVPRIVKLATAMSDGDTTKFTEALYAGVAYQLATAATLTDGSLPVFLVQERA